MADVLAVSAGYNESCALRLDGSLWCWGSFWGSTPHQIDTGGPVSAIESGYFHGCLLRPDATAACQGSNTYGQLGNGSLGYGGEFEAVAGLTDVTAIAAGYESTCALRSNGSLWCWGSNGAGQVGNGGLTSRVTSPSPVPF